jgi:hypothetical protein
MTVSFDGRRPGFSRVIIFAVSRSRGDWPLQRVVHTFSHAHPPKITLPPAQYSSPLRWYHVVRADKHKVPETKNTEEGSARRNIARKHDADPHKWVLSCSYFAAMLVFFLLWLLLIASMRWIDWLVFVCSCGRLVWEGVYFIWELR